MTAIAGLWNLDGRPGGEAVCTRMLAAQGIYGPHDGRQWSNGEMTMGRRLYRLLPEDRFDRQPLVGADGNLTLVADVRLDNRDALIAALGMPAAEGAGRCDAAILLAALERWEEAAVPRLYGDFAFALWNAAQRRLMLVRDFLGQRPLHYYRGKTFFAFATMPKGLHAHPDVPYAPEEQAMAEFIALLPEGDGRSFFKDIRTVEPGCVLTVTAQGEQSRRYWDPNQLDLARPRGEDFVEGIRHHLDEATRARLRGAGGIVATQLSGGFDSGAVSATAARLLAPEGGRVLAFTAVPREGFNGPVPERRIGDEGPLAAATAALYSNIDHVLIRAGHVSPLESLDRYFYLFDRPMLNLCNGTWMVAINQAAKERGLSVMLTGQMGNMSISYAGLELLPELVRSGRLLTLARTGAKLVANGTMRWRGVLANAFGPFIPARAWSRLNRLWGRHWDLFEYTAIRRDRVDAMDLDRLAEERQLDFSYRPRKNGFESRLWVLRRISLGNYNKGMLAGWGVDQRDPTADRRLVEYCLGLPMTAFLADGRLRALPGRALADRLPAAVLNEQRKGYQAADWHEGLADSRAEIRAELERFAECAPAAEMLDVSRLRTMVEVWPETGWNEHGVHNAYRLALLRGISSGHFLRKASGANR